MDSRPHHFAQFTPPIPTGNSPPTSPPTIPQEKRSRSVHQTIRRSKRNGAKSPPPLQIPFRRIPSRRNPLRRAVAPREGTQHHRAPKTRKLKAQTPQEPTSAARMLPSASKMRRTRKTTARLSFVLKPAFFRVAAPALRTSLTLVRPASRLRAPLAMTSK